MQIKEMLANSSNDTKGGKQNIQYIVVHYTANNENRAESNGKYFQQPNRNASAHYFVDESNVVQSVRDEDTAWHCGAKATNMINAEMTIALAWKCAVKRTVRDNTISMNKPKTRRWKWCSGLCKNTACR